MISLGQYPLNCCQTLKITRSNSCGNKSSQLQMLFPDWSIVERFLALLQVKRVELRGSFSYILSTS